MWLDEDECMWLRLSKRPHALWGAIALVAAACSSDGAGGDQLDAPAAGRGGAAKGGTPGGDKEGRLRFPMYEGYGNHDYDPAENYAGWRDLYPERITPGVQAVINRNAKRIGLANVSSEGGHYSWDSGGVHFVNANLFPGNEPSDHHHTSSWSARPTTTAAGTSLSFASTATRSKQQTWPGIRSERPQKPSSPGPRKLFPTRDGVSPKRFAGPAKTAQRRSVRCYNSNS